MNSSFLILIVLFTALLLCTIIIAHAVERHKRILIILLSMFVFFIGFMFSASIYYEGRYKQGQIDAVNGKVKYMLIEKEDKTTEWQEKVENFKLKEKQ